MSNISSYVSPQQVKELMSYLGDIEQMKVFPESEMRAMEAPSKVAFVRFGRPDSYNMAMHLHDTVMGDRQLRVSKVDIADIPDEQNAMMYASPAADFIPLSVAVELARTQSANALLPTPAQSLLGNPPGVQTETTGMLNAMGTAVPPPPPLTGNVDPSKIDEIRRTIYVGNLNTTLTADQVMNFFEPCGKINFVRMAGDETQPTRFAFVEFADHKSMQVALQMNGAMLGDRPVKVNHSKNAIVKPQAKSATAERREVEMVMKKVKEATQLIETVIDPVTEAKSSSHRSRRRSKSSSRSRSRSRTRRSRSRGRRRRHSRSRSYSPRRRRRSRSRSYSPRRRSSRPYERSGSRHSRRRRSRSRSKGRHRRRSRDRSLSKSRSRSRSRTPKKHKSKKSRRRHSPSPSPRRSRSRSKSRSKSRSLSPGKAV